MIVFVAVELINNVNIMTIAISTITTTVLLLMIYAKRLKCADEIDYFPFSKFVIHILMTFIHMTPIILNSTTMIICVKTTAPCPRHCVCKVKVNYIKQVASQAHNLIHQTHFRHCRRQYINH